MQVQVLSTDDNQFKVDSVLVKTTDGGWFNVGFENKWYTSVAPGTNLVRTASYQAPRISTEEVKVQYFRFQTGYAYSSGGYNFSIILSEFRPNGKSCQVVVGDMGPHTYTNKNAPASCEDLQLTTASTIGVSKQSK